MLLKAGNLKKSKGKPSLKAEKQKAWDWFSLYIRAKYADRSGNITCVTCGKVGKWRGDQFQAGHLVSGRSHAILLDEDLVRPQCYTCNMINEGEHARFVMYLKKREGKTDEQIEELLDRKNKDTKYKAFEFTQFAAAFKAMGISICKEKGLL